MLPANIEVAFKETINAYMNEISGISHGFDSGWVCQPTRRSDGSAYNYPPCSLIRLNTTAQVDQCLRVCSALSDVLQATARRYKRQRNTLIPLHNLPTDLFNQILLSFLARPLDIAEPRHYSGLLALRLVSSQWRDMINSTRNLWTFVPMGYGQLNPFLVNLITQRSNPLPLNIEMDSVRSSRASVKVLARHSHRWKSLELYVSSKGDLGGIFSYPTRNLKSF